MILVIVNNGPDKLTFYLKNIGSDKVANKGTITSGEEFTVSISISSMLLLLESEGGWKWSGYVPTNVKGKITCYPKQNKVMYRGWEIPSLSSRRPIDKKYYLLVGGIAVTIVIIIALRKGLK